MTYERHKTIEFVLLAILVVGLLIETLFESPFLITPVTALIILFCMIVNYIVYRRAFPQWKGYGWWMPWTILIPELVIFIVAGVVSMIYNIHVGGIILSNIVLFMILLINAAYDDLYCTRKYEMDRFASVQELFAAYPEARMRFQRGLFTKSQKN